MRIIEEIKLDYKDVLIQPKRSKLNSRKDVELNRTYKFLNSKNEWTGIPIMAANMDGVGTFSMAEELSKFNMFTCITKQKSIYDWNSYMSSDIEYTAISIGTSLEEYKKAKEIIKLHNLKWICIDIANGYSEHFSLFVKTVRNDFPKANIIAGNVVTADMTQELLLSGADIVKIGIGPGSVCTTRIKTGVGYPQLSAVIECADAAHGLNGHIIADGGCTSSGDVAKAFAAGADFVMLGGMFAGHEEGGGTVKEIARKTDYSNVSYDGDILENIYEKQRLIEFYGMSSKTAMETHYGEMADYRSSEGKLVTIPFRGKVHNTVKDILGGIRSTCTYVGAYRLKDLSKCTTFVRCTMQSNNVFGIGV